MHFIGNKQILLTQAPPLCPSQAILYERRKAESQRAEPCCTPPPASGVRVLGVQAPPSLTLPTEQYPSVLVADARGSDRVTVR